MKKILFLLLLSPAFANAQKLVKDETDRFTKEKVKETDWNKLVFKGMNAVRLMAKSANNKVSIDFKLAQHGNKVLTVQEGDYVMLLLDDDNSLKLKIAASSLSQTDLGQKRQNKNLDFESLFIPTDVLSDDDVKALSSHNVKAIRIYLSNKAPMEFEVADKFHDAVKECVKLVM